MAACWSPSAAATGISVSNNPVEFRGAYRQETDEEFGEDYWTWIWDKDTLAQAYDMAVQLGDPTPELRAA